MFLVSSSETGYCNKLFLEIVFFFYKEKSKEKQSKEIGRENVR